MDNIFNKNPLFDKNFLNDLFNFQHKEVYARITLLTAKENPLEQIEGKIIDGTVNIDGTSAVRRTCSLNMTAENININEFYWGLKNKFKLEVGLKNNINSNYPDIIWFKQGIFVITQFNTNYTINKWDIKIQGKDKMCLLNGEMSGQLPPTDFAIEQYTDKETGIVKQERIPIKTIIFKLLQEFALELPHNIIINDIDDYGYELLEYRGQEPFYLFKNIHSGNYDNMTINSNLECYYQLKEILSLEEYNLIPEEYNFLKDIYIIDNSNTYVFNPILANDNINYKLRIREDKWFKGKISDIFNINYNNLLDQDILPDVQHPLTTIRFLKNNTLSKDTYTIVKIKQGDIPGYRPTDLVFAGELKSNAGESITSILDKIKNQFTNFEYYYDIDGKFVFQKKQEYLETPWNSVQKNNGFNIDAGINSDNSVFSFLDNKLIISFQNTPKLQELKNDYSVHGNRENLAIRMRYAIDYKPELYTPIRPLKEKIVKILRDDNGYILNKTIEYKYYDAPEIEPYNDLGLISTDESYKIIELLDEKVNNKNNKNVIFNTSEFKQLEEFINPSTIGEQNYAWWLTLFSNVNAKSQRLWMGSINDIQKIIEIINKNHIIYDNEISMTIIPTEDKYSLWTIIYPYYAKYPYSVKHLVLDNNSDTEKIIFKEKLDKNDNVIHYKLDWRELIYQMGLDYRKLNHTENYYFYLKEMNDFVSNGQTGYEQYYTDLISNWRDLYCINPELNFNNITYNEIRNQDLNDIYIKNGYYSPLRGDIDNISYKNLFKLSKPFDSSEKSIYPFYMSDSCYLLKTGENYYLKDESNNKMTLINSNVYETLSKINPERIYIKNNEEFFTLNYSENIVVFTSEKPYKPYVYYNIIGYDEIQLDNDFNLRQARIQYKENYYEKQGTNYIITNDDTVIPNKKYYKAIYRLSEKFESNKIYYELTPTKRYGENKYHQFSSSWDEGKVLNNYLETFKENDYNVANYPYTDKINLTDIELDYKIFAEAQLSKISEDILFNEDFYIQKNNYQKINSNINLFDLYYRSNLYPLSYKTSEIINDLDNLINNLSSFKTTPIVYNEEINNIFKKYINALHQYNYNDISNMAYIIIKNYCDLYMNNIKTLAEKYNLYDIEESSLYTIYYTLLKDYNNINKNTSNLSGIEGLYFLNNLIDNLNKILEKTLNSILLNYNQSSFIINDIVLKNILLTEDNSSLTDKYQLESILNIKNQLNTHLKTIDSLAISYSDGQIQKIKVKINNILDIIEKNIQDKCSELLNNNLINSNLFTSSGNLNFTDNKKNQYYSIIISSMYEESIVLLKSLFDLINILKFEYDHIIDFISIAFIWGPTFKDLESNQDEQLKNIIERKKETHNLYNMLVFLKNIKNIFLESNSFTDILNYLKYKDFYLFKDLQYELRNSFNLNKTLEKFKLNTSSFQESIILEDVNNFNEINQSNKIIYIPINYYKSFYLYNHDYKNGDYWQKDIFNNPQLLTFWFDFLEPSSFEMSKYAVSNIGMRTKTINDTMIKSIHYKDIPQIIFTSNNSEDKQSGYSYINLTPAFSNLFSISSKGKTAKERIEELIYNHLHSSENINISTIPVYILEPNNKIYIYDEKSKINGEYLIDKITIPLNFKKMMSITASKSISNII